MVFVSVMFVTGPGKKYWTFSAVWENCHWHLQNVTTNL